MLSRITVCMSNDSVSTICGCGGSILCNMMATTAACNFRSSIRLDFVLLRDWHPATAWHYFGYQPVEDRCICREAQCNASGC